MNECEDELICDFAQVYHIYDWRELPPTKVATLTVGLPQNSRVKRKLSDITIDMTDMLLALAVDCLKILIWQNTEDGHKNRNHPQSIYKKLLGIDKQVKNDLDTFNSPEEYLQWHEAKARKNHE